MYCFIWVVLVAISVLIGLAAFIWAIRTGQFSDQVRARYLALSEDVHLLPDVNPSKLTKEVYVLLVIGAVGLIVLMAPVALSIYRAGGGG